MLEPCCHRFTAAEGGARLAAAASTNNTLITECASFISTRLVYEEAYSVRGLFSTGKKRSVRICRGSNVKPDAYELRILTDLKVAEAETYYDVQDWRQELEVKEVLVSTSVVFRKLLEEGLLKMVQINVLVIDSCHLIYKDEHLQYIMKIYKQTDEQTRPRILAITYPLFTSKPDALDNTEHDIDNINHKALDSKDNVEQTGLDNETTDDESNTTENIIDKGKSIEHGKIVDDKDPLIDKSGIDGKSIIKSQSISSEKDEEVNNQSIDVKESIGEAENKHIENVITDNIAKDNQIDNKALKDNELIDKAAKEELAIDKTDNLETIDEKDDTDKDKKDPKISDKGIKFGVYENMDDYKMYENLEWKIDQLEKELCCKMDLAEDIDSCKRLSGPVPKPKELLVEYGIEPTTEIYTEEYKDLEAFMKNNVYEAIDFLNDHRHDPTEIYGDELYEEFKNIPDPTIEPIGLLNEFLYVLHELGPYAADKAAFTLLVKLEKLKIKVPYERHFLLLRLCTTVFVKIRCYFDLVMSKYESDWDKIRLYSTPKLMRLIEILEKFTPDNQSGENTGENSNEVDKDTKIDDENRIGNDSDSQNTDVTGQNVADNQNTNVTGQNVADNQNINASGQKVADNENINAIGHDNQNINASGQKVVDNQANSKDIGPSLSAEVKFDNNTKISDTEIDINKTDINKSDTKTQEGKQKESDTNTNEINKDTQDSNVVDTDSNQTDTANINTENKVKKLIQDIDKCDFASLGDKIEDKLNIISGNLKDLDVDIQANVDSQANSDINKEDSVIKPRRGRQRRPRVPRSARQHAAPNSLCGILYINQPIMAKILFIIVAELTRCRPALSFITCQYCAVETHTEQKEVEKQGKRHEEVLKKFRMHECNLLLTTLALEEGIDLPRCNLVLRWDLPPSYRSHVLCRSRGRAPRSTAALLCPATNKQTDLLLHNLATYTELDQIITRKCGCGIQNEPSIEEENEADAYNILIKPYTPNDRQTDRQNQEINHKESPENQVKSDSRNQSDIGGLKMIGSDIGVGKSKNQLVGKDSQKDTGAVKDSRKDTGAVKDHKDTGAVKDSQKDTGAVKDSQKDTGAVKDSHKDTGAVKDHKDTGAVKDSNKDTEDIGNKLTANSLKHNQNDTLTNNQIDRHNLKQIESALKDLKLDTNICNKEIDANRYNNVDVGNTRIDSDVNKCDSDEIKNDIENVASVDLNSAIALINRYCAKLPSDTFTRLAPQWWVERVRFPDEVEDAYICTLRLPLNCPIKYNIVGHPMPSPVLARRVAALQACRVLHCSGELDQQLMPIGKENFKAAELENNSSTCDKGDLDDTARPGTTKRRQYYYKRTASAFTDCQPVIDTSDSEIDGPQTNTNTNKHTDNKDNTGVKRNTLYLLQCVLQCALPERYNTRGRTLHAPQHAPTALAILINTAHPHSLQIPSFPVYTRSGEVRVSVEHIPDADVRMSPRRGRLVRRFMRFVFTEVLRVRRKGMKLQSEGSTKNNYYIVPTIKTINPDGTTKIDIDWPFLELIYKHTEEKKRIDIEKPLLWGAGEEKEEGKCLLNPLLKPGEIFVFDADKYKEAVVTPWYRNQDQPQFFLVAEICWNLTPDSAFPSCTHSTFRSYYRSKYNVELTQPDQPLLDVDHTSARLNLLTPRYVNRKGVALPVSSERTRRAKRDRLDQKQILVPELCTTHPFAAPLWFATVALPCVLYRINALLIADEIRRAVAIDVGLGIPRVDEVPGFQWPPLDFGWSLAEVLSADAEKNEKKKEEDKEKELKDKEIRDKEEKIRDSKEIEPEEKQEKTINDILQEKEDAESGFEIGTWSNDMASSIPDSIEYDDMMEPLPANLTFCTSASGGVNWCDPIQKPKQEYSASRNYQRNFSMADSDCSFMSSDFDTDDSDFDSEGSDDDADGSGFCNSKNSNAAVGVRIEYKTAHEAEAVDLERKKNVIPAPQRDPVEDERDRAELSRLLKSGDGDPEYTRKFRESVYQHKLNIQENGDLIKKDEPITDLISETKQNVTKIQDKTLSELFPFKNEKLQTLNGKITIESIEKNKRCLLQKLRANLTDEEIKGMHCFAMKDIDIDSPDYVNEKIANIGFDTKEKYEELLKDYKYKKREFVPYYLEGKKVFDFDFQPDLEGHPGPSPSVILQALTMSNANDGINLERLETIGDSFLKFAITAYLYCAHPTVHEGKLSHMRSKQVSNLNLYRLGRGVKLGARMIASKFEPHDNWLPPCHRPPHPHKSESKEDGKNNESQDANGCYIPYNLITQHSIPDKSVADCVEALIGAYLVETGARGALVFMSWLGIKVVPHHLLTVEEPEYQTQKSNPTPKSAKRERTYTESSLSSQCSSHSDTDTESDIDTDMYGGVYTGPVGARRPYRDEDGTWKQLVYGELKAPPSPLLRYIEDPEGELERMLSGYDELERTLAYRFKDRSLLLQALTHASHHTNTLTDCYQRLEFLGDAILDYLITRHLFEDSRRHTPGALTDLRSALVNNTIFATLAVRHGFHKYFRHMSPGLNEVLTKYVKIQEENGHSISEEHYLIQEDELEQAEDVEVPKALGDLFESVAGAIFLDSGMSVGAVWRSYERLMGAELEAFSAAAPKSPVRELLEAEPDTAKFGKPERLADGRRVRVCVEVFGRGTFKGIGRNYRIAKGTAARCALRHLKIHRR